MTHVNQLTRTLALRVGNDDAEWRALEFLGLLLLVLLGSITGS